MVKHRKIQVKITYMEHLPQESDTESESDGESAEFVLQGLKEQMAEIETLSKALDTHVLDLYRRTKSETTDWMNEPLLPRAHIRNWCSKNGLPPRPTVNQFIDACFAASSSMDLESRTLTFPKGDAAILWSGQRRLSVFDVVARVPTLFE